MIALTVCCFILSVIAGMAAFFFSWGAKEEIASADPAYSRRLYLSSGSRLLRNQWPVHPYVLFAEAPPDTLAGTVKTLRILYGAFWACLGLSLAIVIVGAVTSNAT